MLREVGHITFASAPAVAGSVLMQKFKLVLGQCGKVRTRVSVAPMRE